MSDCIDLKKDEAFYLFEYYMAGRTKRIHLQTSTILTIKEAKEWFFKEFGMQCYDNIIRVKLEQP